ncbi:MAG: hypothetical protein WCD27_04200, partial [Candidatus Acidiferrales bacterium]
MPDALDPTPIIASDSGGVDFGLRACGLGRFRSRFQSSSPIFKICGCRRQCRLEQNNVLRRGRYCDVC